MDWLTKYKPTKLNELSNCEQYLKKMNDWINNIKKTNKIILSIQGPVGCGKSILAELFLNSKNYNIIYNSISSIKNKNDFIEKIKDSSTKYDILNLLNSNKTINAYIVDDVDNSNLSKNDLNTIIKFLLKNKNPLIIIGTYNKSVNYPKKHLITLNINTPNNILLNSVLNNILNKESIECNNILKNKIIKHSQNDIRKLIIISEYLFTKSSNIEKDIDNIESIIFKKDYDYNLYNTYNILFNNYNSIKKFNYNNEPLIQHLMYNNIFNEILFNTNSNSKEILNYMINIYDNLNLSLLFESYSYNTFSYNYDFLNYASILSLNTMMINYHKLKKKTYRKFNELEYPRNIYITNQNNLFKKNKYLFIHEPKFYMLKKNTYNHYLIHHIKQNVNKDKFIIKYLPIKEDNKIELLNEL